jgi:hypothetical protein
MKKTLRQRSAPSFEETSKAAKNIEKWGILSRIVGSKIRGYYAAKKPDNT